MDAKELVGLDEHSKASVLVIQDGNGQTQGRYRGHGQLPARARGALDEENPYRHRAVTSNSISAFFELRFRTGRHAISVKPRRSSIVA